MEMYATPIEGTYIRRRPDFQGNFYREEVKVKVLGETDKSFLIKLYCAIGNHRGGDQLKVRKHNVRMPRTMSVSSGLGPYDKPERQYDYSGAYWNN